MSERHEGWNRPMPERIPRSTAWPAAMSLAITLVAWGVVTSPMVLIVGFGLFGISLAGWIGEIRHERREG